MITCIRVNLRIVWSKMETKTSLTTYGWSSGSIMTAHGFGSSTQSSMWQSLSSISQSMGMNWCTQCTCPWTPFLTSPRPSSTSPASGKTKEKGPKRLNWHGYCRIHWKTKSMIKLSTLCEEHPWPIGKLSASFPTSPLPKRKRKLKKVVTKIPQKRKKKDRRRSSSSISLR